MIIRDRIKELRRVKASQLKTNPRNWRRHPLAQQNALRAVLSEVGYADALLARETDDGSLELIDGHLRAEVTPDCLVPVLVLDVSRQEADKILATHDPLAAMAETDQRQLDALLEQVETGDANLQRLLDDLTTLADVELEGPAVEPPLPPAYQVVVLCADESQQQLVYQRLIEQGYQCRVLTL